MALDGEMYADRTDKVEVRGGFYKICLSLLAIENSHPELLRWMDRQYCQFRLLLCRIQLNRALTNGVPSCRHE
jgi:hypothetical protein